MLILLGFLHLLSISIILIVLLILFAQRPWRHSIVWETWCNLILLPLHQLWSCMDFTHVFRLHFLRYWHSGQTRALTHPKIVNYWPLVRDLNKISRQSFFHLLWYILLGLFGRAATVFIVAKVFWRLLFILLLPGYHLNLCLLNLLDFALNKFLSCWRLLGWRWLTITILLLSQFLQRGGIRWFWLHGARLSDLAFGRRIS